MKYPTRRIVAYRFSNNISCNNSNNNRMSQSRSITKGLDEVVIVIRTTSGAPTPKRPPSDPKNMVVKVEGFVCLEGDGFCTSFMRCPMKRDDDDDDCVIEKADAVVVKRMTNPMTTAGTIREMIVVIVIVIVIVGGKMYKYIYQ
jgi:hypothetical protein